MRDHWNAEDRARLTPHNARVLEFMLNGPTGCWFELDEIARGLGLRNGSTVASRLRDIKAQTNYTYERERTETKGVFKYRLIVPDPNPTQLSLLEA